MIADRKNIKADGKDLSFITARVVDAAGNMLPDADNLIQFSIKGDAEIVGTDNGLQTSMESFKTNMHKAYNGLCLAVVQSKENESNVVVTATSQGLETESIIISIKK